MSTTAPDVSVPLTLLDLPLKTAGRVVALQHHAVVDGIAQRLADLGFVAGEPLRVLGYGPVGRDPLLVQVGHTRFALRRDEAERIQVELAA